MTLKDFAIRLQPHLDRFLDRKITEYGSSTLDPLLSELFSYPKRLLNAGGKRVRPYIASVMYEAAGGTLDDKVMDALAGLEFFHLFALIHDDVIDRGNERHGIPTVNAYAEAQMRKQDRLADIPHIAEAQAILIGDLIFSWAFEAFETASAWTPQGYSQAAARFRQMVDEVVVGQMIDADLMTRPRATVDLIERKMLLKTASYTFIRPMQMGIALAGGNPKLDVFADAFGESIGMAYQIQDDFLEIISDSKVIQKRAFSDLTDRQHTLFTQHIFEHGTAEQIAFLAQCLGKPVSPDQVERVRALFHESGAITAGETRIRELFEQAHDTLALAALPTDAHDALSVLLKFVHTRTS